MRSLLSLCNRQTATFPLCVLPILLILRLAPVSAQLIIPAAPPVSDVTVLTPSAADGVHTPGGITESVSFAPEVSPVPPVPGELTRPESPLPAAGYWIVSTAGSPQSFDDTVPRFCVGVSRVDECAGPRSSSLVELAESLNPEIPVCIVVHGSFMDSPSIFPESCATWRWLRAGSGGIPFQMIYFSWPSDRALSLLPRLDVGVLGRRASRNGFYLATLIHHLPPACPVSLIGHSHGTRVIASSLHLMGGGVVEDFRLPWAGETGRRIRTVFAASAIDHDWFNPGERFDRALCCSECVLNLRNCKDPALLVYPLRRIASSRALGATGLTAKDRRQLGYAGAKVHDLDVSDRIGPHHLWPHYLKHLCLARQISHCVCFPDLTVVTSAASDHDQPASFSISSRHVQSGSGRDTRTF